MTESYVIEVAGFTAGIVVREPGQRRFSFHAAERRFGRFDGQSFAGPREAERVLRQRASAGRHASDIARLIE
jgi:hypothetical protein